MNRVLLLAALSLFASTTLACSAATDGGRDADGTVAAESALSRSNLAKAVRDEIDEHGFDRLTLIDRAGLKSGGHALREAQKAFDEVERAYRNDGSTAAYRFGSGTGTAFIVLGDGGDDSGYDVRVFTANDKFIMRGDAPSSAEQIEWSVIGEPVSERTANGRKATADKVKAAIEQGGTSGMTAIDRRGIYAWGAPLRHAVEDFDNLKAEYGTVEAHRAKLDGDWVFILEASNDDGARVLAYNEFDICVLEGNASSSSEPMEWTYRGLTIEH